MKFSITLHFLVSLIFAFKSFVLLIVKTKSVSFQHCSGELCKGLMISPNDPASVVSTFDWRQEFIEMLLDFEEKVMLLTIISKNCECSKLLVAFQMEQGGIGHLHLGGSSALRERWRESLSKEFSTTEFLNGMFPVLTSSYTTFYFRISLRSVVNLSE